MDRMKPAGYLLIFITFIAFLGVAGGFKYYIEYVPEKPRFEISQKVFLKTEQVPIDTVTEKGTHDHRELEYLRRKGYDIETDYIIEKVIHREVELTLIQTKVVDNTFGEIVYFREHVLDSVDHCEEKTLAQAFVDKEMRKHFVIDSINVSLNNCQ
jgi:hypothetical protein